MSTSPMEDADEVTEEEEAAEAAREERSGERSETAAPERAAQRPLSRPREREGGRRERRFRRPKRKVCAFCVDKVKHIDYKDHARLQGFVSDRGKILKSRMTGSCSRHQRKLAKAIKRARQVALLPFVAD